MKKFLLSAAAVFAALSMNAQEICTFNADNALGLDSENGTALTAGTVIGETESIVATIGADDTYKPQSAKFTVNGTEIAGGLQGGTNPKDADGGVPATTLVEPASGAYLVFEAKADGYLYVMHKASSNKAYSVFEEGTAISYTFAAIGDAATDLGAVYEFTLPYEEENEQYAIKESIGWAEQEYLKINDPEKYAAHQTTGDDGTVSWTAIKVNGLGVIAFPVYKDCKYIVNANGSKLTAAGFVFSTEDNVAISSDGVAIYTGEGATPIEMATWTVAGGSNLMGSNWDTTDTTNDMTSTDGVTYTLVKEGVVLEKGVTYEYKVAKDHAWTEAYPADNATLTVDETAEFTVTFTFNAVSQEVSATTVKTGEAEIGEKTYSVIGTINGNWDNDTDMTLNEENQKYTAEFENVAAGKYEFKVRVNHDWAENYGTDGNNYVIEVEQDGSYVLVVFDPETKGISTVIVDPAPVPVGDASISILNADNVLELDSENGTALAAGTGLGAIDEVTCVIGADDTYKPQEVTAVINGTTVKGGLQGGTNPKDADGGVPATTLQAPVSGAYLEFTANKDGFLYVIHKASSNKAYTVFEEGTAIGYKFAAVGDAATDLGAVYGFELKGEGELNEVKNSVEWAEQEFLKATDPEKYAAHQTINEDGTTSWTAIKVNGLGVIAFPVFKDCRYIVNANGSKITAGAYAFSEADDVTIATEDGIVFYIGGGEVAIQSAKVAKAAANGAIYNIAGQKVNASYKGLVIKNGKKYIQK